MIIISIININIDICIDININWPKDNIYNNNYNL